MLSRDALMSAVVAPAVAAALMLVLFAIFNRWDKLGDPINSIVALALGVAGFGAAVALDRLRTRRRVAHDGGTADGA